MPHDSPSAWARIAAKGLKLETEEPVPREMLPLRHALRVTLPQTMLPQAVVGIQLPPLRSLRQWLSRCPLRGATRHRRFPTIPQPAWKDSLPQTALPQTALLQMTLPGPD